MNRYRVFIFSFIANVVALFVFLCYYVHALVGLIQYAGQQRGPELPLGIMHMLFSPPLLLSLLVLIGTSILYRVLGIIFIARNPLLEGGEKAMWIIGFVMLSFITAIVFMAMATSRNLTAKETIDLPKY